MPRRGAAYRLAAAVLQPGLTLITRRDWRGGRHLPASGGVLVCSNHLSNADPLTLAHYLHAHGRSPRFLAKQEIFGWPVVGAVVRSAGQIPVYRNTDTAAQAYADAVTAVRAGECVVIYPEGTLTMSDQLWPMAGKTGAARVALSTGCPVVPVAQWGPQQIMAPRDPRLHLLGRHTIRVKAGAALDLSDLPWTDGADRDADAVVLRQATERIMAAITELLTDLRDTP